MSQDLTAFEQEWYELARVITDRIYATPEAQLLEKEFKANGKLSFEQRSDFIALSNRVKAEVIRQTYGAEGAESFASFKDRWRQWYDNKGVASSGIHNRRLTNEEHIVFSSTPEAEEFFSNREHSN